MKKENYGNEVGHVFHEAAESEKKERSEHRKKRSHIDLIEKVVDDIIKG